MLRPAVQLREGDDGNLKVHGEGFEAAADPRDFLLPVVATALGFAVHQLQVVDHDEAESVLTLDTPAVGADLREGDAGVRDDE